jgi:hypothetical protein
MVPQWHYARAKSGVRTDRISAREILPRSWGLLKGFRTT